MPIKNRITLCSNAGAGTTTAVVIPETGTYKMFVQGTYGGSGSLAINTKYGLQSAFIANGAALTAPSNARTIDLLQGEEIQLVATDITALTVEIGFIR